MSINKHIINDTPKYMGLQEGELWNTIASNLYTQAVAAKVTSGTYEYDLYRTALACIHSASIFISARREVVEELERARSER